MILTLSTKNKLGFVNGTISAPEITSVEYKAWQRCNDLVIWWLVFNQDENIARSVFFFKTARVIWKDLEDGFGFVSIPHISSLEQNLADLHQGQLSVYDFTQSSRLFGIIWMMLMHYRHVIVRNAPAIWLVECRRCKKNIEFYNFLWS